MRRERSAKRHVVRATSRGGVRSDDRSGHRIGTSRQRRTHVASIIIGEEKRLMHKRSSKYKGVSWHNRNNSYIARIWYNGKSKHLGVFRNEVAAALAVDKATLEMHGLHAKKLNFPDAGERAELMRETSDEVKQPRKRKCSVRSIAVEAVQAKKNASSVGMEIKGKHRIKAESNTLPQTEACCWKPAQVTAGERDKKNAMTVSERNRRMERNRAIVDGVLREVSTF